MIKAKIGIIGGSGLYNIEGIKYTRQIKVTTPFGSPSDKLVIADFNDTEVIFLPRHGKGHRLLPSEINYRANIYAMKKLGVERIISVSAVGSLRPNIKPLDIVIPDQFFDRTYKRKSTFFGDGMVAHVTFAHPTCPYLGKILYDTAKSIGLTIHMGGVYLNMEGPAFSTKAESLFYQSIGMSVIGMTNLTEAKLAREAEICYSTMALVTDFDCWHEMHEEVTVDLIIANMAKNVQNAKKILALAPSKIKENRDCQCASALSDSIVTSADVIPKKTKNKLKLIVGKYIK